ncbi:SDR family NAD(P)-dependent oxidoreductase [Streptomyces sp. NPDC020801]|uniref:SDR family NAD(P)-dependent oxidoreductase n=1 Tax=unclassified Streptomyces TaxID=2593676 RepID=UPI0037A87166
MTPKTEDTPARAVIVTGGGTGIGRATAWAFAEQGADVLVTGRTSSSLAGTAKGHAAIRTLTADLADPDAPRLIVEAALREFGRIDVLVNNAAVARYAGLADTTDAMALEQVRTNLLAPLGLTRCALEALEAAGGTVVNVSTAGARGSRAWPDNGVYGASKAALDFLTRTWAVELAPRGIRVAGIAPGVVDTGTGVRMGMAPEHYRAFLGEMSTRTPAGRVGTADEIAWWITELADSRARYATGVVLPVDGGLSLT